MSLALRRPSQALAPRFEPESEEPGDGLTPRNVEDAPAGEFSQAPPNVAPDLGGLGFQSPTGNVRCSAQAAHGLAIDCVRLNDGLTVNLDYVGPPTVIPVRREVLDLPTLVYGEPWGVSPFTPLRSTGSNARAIKAAWASFCTVRPSDHWPARSLPKRKGRRMQRRGGQTGVGHGLLGRPRGLVSSCNGRAPKVGTRVERTVDDPAGSEVAASLAIGAGREDLIPSIHRAAIWTNPPRTDGPAGPGERSMARMPSSHPTGPTAPPGPPARRNRAVSRVTSPPGPDSWARRSHPSCCRPPAAASVFFPIAGAYWARIGHTPGAGYSEPHHSQRVEGRSTSSAASAP